MRKDIFIRIIKILLTKPYSCVSLSKVAKTDAEDSRNHFGVSVAPTEEEYV